MGLGASRRSTHRNLLEGEETMRSARAVLRSVLLFSLAATATFAQTTFATITGTVTDPNEAVVPNTTVEATHVQSNYRYTASSNQAGVYTLGQLRDCQEITITLLASLVGQDGIPRTDCQSV